MFMITITVMIATNHDYNSSIFVFMFAHTKVPDLTIEPTRVVAKPPYFSSLSFATRVFRPWHIP